MTCIYTVEHVESVFLPLQVRRAARLSARAAVRLSPRQASVIIVLSHAWSLLS